MKIALDPKKVLYDGNSFVVVYSDDELKDRFEKLQLQIAKDLQEIV